MWTCVIKLYVTCIQLDSSRLQATNLLLGCSTGGWETTSPRSWNRMLKYRTNFNAIMVAYQDGAIDVTTKVGGWDKTMGHMPGPSLKPSLAPVRLRCSLHTNPLSSSSSSSSINVISTACARYKKNARALQLSTVKKNYHNKSKNYWK